MIRSTDVRCGLGRSVAFALLGLVVGFGPTAVDVRQPNHGFDGSTASGADLKGLLNGVAVPMVSPIQGYGISGEKGTYRSFNEAQNLGVNYRVDGFDLTVSNGDVPRRTSFSLVGVGRGDEELVPAAALSEVVEGGRLEVDHGTFRMLYENGPRGMRHDVVVLQGPQGHGPLEARLRIAGDLLAVQTSRDEVIFNAYDGRSMGLSPVLRYNGLHAWDAEGRVLPSGMELRGDLLVLSVQDERAVYPVTIDPISSTADLELTGGQAGEAFGFSVATAGDVNGDGYSDIIVGAPNWDLPFTDAGRAMIFLGSATGIGSTPAWTVQGTGANARFGFSVSSAGDLNGDGISDVVVGAPGHNGYGAAFAYVGSAPSGPGTVAAIIWTGDMQAGSEFGRAVALAGDVNGDGYSDVLVGAPLFNVPPSGSDQGRAYCYHGNTLALGWNANGSATNAQFGFSVAGAGDLNGDGLGDVAVGAPYQPKLPTSNNGYAYVFQGNSPGGLSAAPGGSRSGGASANLGYSLSSAGDMNGDGYADLIIGAPGAAAGNGAAYVYRGTSAGTGLIEAANISLAGVSVERLGQSVSMAGDVNGDGYGDVIVGSPGHAANKGRVQVFRGGPSPLLDAAHLLWSRVGTVAGDRLGAAVHTAGDVNGDGISDLMLAAPDQAGMGAVSIFHGATDLLPTTYQWSQLGTASNFLGSSVSSAGDVNGDGYSDVIIGAPNGVSGGVGKAMLYLGSATGLSAAPVWTGTGENADDLYGNVVASAGDVNGDGYGDVLVGAPGYPNYAWRGKLYLYLGSPSGLSAAPAWAKTGENVDDRFGYGASSAGDVNGDGYSDVLVGAYMFGEPTDHGKVYVFNGSSTGLPSVANWTAMGTSSSFYGATVSNAGDVNGDGYDDVLVGAPLHDVAQDDNRGGAFLYNGSPSGPSTSPSWSAFGAHSGSQFGESVSYAGDVNGDGYSDVIVGEYFYTNGGNEHTGRAYVFQGSPFVGLPASANTIIEGTQLDGQMGVSVCAAGDVNGDGFGDVIVGAHLQSMFYLNQGMASVHLGSAGGSSATAAWTAYGTGTGSRFGFSVALAGDVNGDGYSDVVVGADRQTAANGGGAFVFQGNLARSLPMPTYQYRGDLLTPVRTNNGTFDPGCAWGIGQLARSSMGRGKVKLVWQYVGHGPAVPTSPFNNHSTGYTGQDATWSDSGLSGALLKRSLTTPGTTTGHPAWRARVRQHPATALDGRPFGRWFEQGVHDLQVPSIKTELAGCGPLPVTLVGQSVECADGHALLEWATASEQDCANFSVLRSRDGEEWETIGLVPCSGNSSSFLRYRLVDTDAMTGGVAYYRLDQYDINGTVARYPTMVLTPCAAPMSVIAWPNPFQEELFIRLSTLGPDDETILATVRDIMGRAVLERTVELSDRSVGRIDGLPDLPQGPYVIELHSPSRGRLGQVQVVRM